jgi:hypothetical protein
MPRVGLETMTPPFEWAKSIHALVISIIRQIFLRSYCNVLLFLVHCLFNLGQNYLKLLNFLRNMYFSVDTPYIRHAVVFSESFLWCEVILLCIRSVFSKTSYCVTSVDCRKVSESLDIVWFTLNYLTWALQPRLYKVTAVLSDIPVNSHAWGFSKLFPDANFSRW